MEEFIIDSEEILEGSSSNELTAIIPLLPSSPTFVLYEIFSIFLDKSYHPLTWASVPASSMKPSPITPDGISTTDYS